MPDRLYLSFWLKDFNPELMPARFGQLLRAFPFSQLRPGISLLKVLAIGESEPPLLERAFAEPPGVEEVLRAAAEFSGPDCALVAEGYWELWRWEGQWRLRPSPVVLSCFGPLFENDLGDHLRVELGWEAQFLPDASLPQAARTARSNLRSVLRLSEDVTKACHVARRLLWSESGEDLVRLLEESLAECD